MRPGFIERSIELARDGQCGSIEAIITALTREGYDGAYAHLQGRQTRERLDALCGDARRAAAMELLPAET